jgi:hypothetical protein
MALIIYLDNKIYGGSTKFMKRCTTIQIFFIFLSIMFIPSCSMYQTPNKNATITAIDGEEYIIYIPIKSDLIRLKFYYPADWDISEEHRIDNTKIAKIGLADPRFRSLPTQIPNTSTYVSNDFGRITIVVQPITETINYETLIDSYRDGGNNSQWIIPINEYQLIVDNLNAIALEYQLEPYDDNGYLSTMFERTIFFMQGDQIYQISLIMAQNDRYNSFEKGYDNFISSLMIVD